MNSTKKNSEFGGVKKKLTAAIAMLLVATIMMVSSTYAWFTLSTAPEVTGITTSVGANGNLEMALLNGNANDDATDGANNSGNTYKDMTRITSNVGDSSAAADQTVAKANMTWGNLVDLGATDGNKNVYGLDKITLNPARLHIEDGKVSVAESILNTATYGNDGRVVNVSGKTYSTANYTDGSFKFVADNASYGVRAIGGNDNLSKQQAGLLAAKAAYVQYMNAAKGKVVTSVQQNGQNLTNAILTLATDEGGTKTITDQGQQNAIKALIQAFSDGADQIDLAYIEAIKAAATYLEEAKYETVLSAINDKTTASAAVAAIQALAAAAGETQVSMNIPAEISTAIAALANLRNSIKAASDSVNAGTADYKAALNALVKTSSDSSILINGFKLKEPAGGPVDDEKYVMVKKTDGSNDYTYSSDFISSAMKGVEVKMGDGTGVFAEFASLANNYSIPTIVTVKVSLGGMTIDLKDVSFTLTTTANVTNYTNVTKAVTDATAAGNTTAASTFLSDTYGYAIDLAFRTNAAGSSLLLATDGEQRIYDGSNNTNTLGGGSTMTFKTVDGAVMTTDQIKALMGAIRVVFMNPEDGTIYGIASVDNIAADTEDTTALTGKLTLKTYTFEQGVIKLTDKAVSGTTEDEKAASKKANATLLELPQNTPTRLSVVVYLDGDKVNNSMVANTDVMQSITGSLNLQFKSSETLVPMNYTPLKNGTAATTPVQGG